MTTITALFDTRREAELAVEHLVQEYEIDRDAIVIGPDGEENSVGLETSGSDEETVDEEANDDEAALNGSILVRIAIEDDEASETIEDVLLEYGASNITDAA